jgi:hypothetical protein
MTQTRQMLEEVYLFFDELSSIIIHKDMRQSLPKSVPQPDRVITGSHRGETDSWSSTSPSLLFETQQTLMEFQSIPLMLDSQTDPQTIQNLFLQNKLPYEKLDQVCARMGINFISQRFSNWGSRPF